MDSEPIRVFIAEDEPKGYKLIHMLIDWAGLDMEEIGASQDGLEALESINLLKPDIVVTDIRMPGIDGLEMIRRHKLTGADTRFIIISGHREFDYARKSLKLGVDDYILKPVQKEDLNRSLKKISDQLRSVPPEKALEQQLADSQSRFRRKVMEQIARTWNQSDTSKIDTVCEEFDRDVAGRGVFQALFLVPGISEYDNSWEVSFLTNLQEKFIDLSYRVIGKNCLDFFSCRLVEGIVMLLRFEESSEKRVTASIQDFAERTLIRLDPLGGGGIFIGTGTGTGTGTRGKGSGSWLPSIRSAIASVRNCCERSWSEAVFCKAPDKQEFFFGLTPIDAKNLAVFAETLDCGAFEIWLDAFIEKVCPDKSGSYLHAMAEALFEHFLHSLPNKNFFGDRKDLHETLYDGFRHVKEPKDILNVVRRPLCKAMHELTEERRLRESLPVRKIREYIDENYSRQIRLEDMASSLQMNATYLGTLFRNETGVLFSSYLTQRRIEAAKEALRVGRSTLAQIAMEVGYPEVKYFFKVFRKQTGITPGEYRRIYQ